MPATYVAPVRMTEGNHLIMTAALCGFHIGVNRPGWMLLDRDAARPQDRGETA